MTDPTAPKPPPERAPDPVAQASEPAPKPPPERAPDAAAQASEPSEPSEQEPPRPASAEPAPKPPDQTPAPTVRSVMFAAARRPGRAQLLAAVLLGLLGFSLVVQARQTSSGSLTGLRQSDLVRILDDVTERSTRLDEETRQLQHTQEQLQSGTDRTAAAEQAAKDRLAVLGILAGTLPAAGPGVQLLIADPNNRVNAALLLDTVEELRDAGAEAMQISDPTDSVRVVAATSFVDGASNGVGVDNHRLDPPYTLTAIGDPATMAAALDIPGGVLDTLQGSGARGTVTSHDTLQVTALHPVTDAQYARPAPAGSP